MCLSIHKDGCIIAIFWLGNAIWILDVKPKMTLADELAAKPMKLTLLEYRFGNFYHETPADDSVSAIEQKDNGQMMTKLRLTTTGDLREFGQVPNCYLPNKLILSMSIIIGV
jgi:hypothetical protein